MTTDMKSIADITNITIETSTLCNAKCVICPNNMSPREPYLMPLDTFESIVRKFSNLNTIALCGMYEPLLDNRLPQIFKIIKKTNSNMKVVIYTNAGLLDKWENFLLEEDNLFSIIFSVHGFTSNTYNTIMKGLDRDKTYQNIVNFCTKRKIKFKNFPKYTPKTTVSFIRTSLNKSELKEFTSFWKNYVDTVTNYELMNWNGHVSDYEHLQDKPKKTIRPCPMFEQPLVIDAFGNVSRCCYNLKFSYGNTKTNGIEKWLSKKRVTEVYPDIDCIKCDGWRL